VKSGSDRHVLFSHKRHKIDLAPFVLSLWPVFVRASDYKYASALAARQLLFGSLNPNTKRMNSKYDVVVIGGGHNGLANAAYRARAGTKVPVLERRHVLGGAA
jgi:hypothetical protein